MLQIPMVQSYINIEMLQTQYVEKESHIDLKIGDNNSINQYRKGQAIYNLITIWNNANPKLQFAGNHWSLKKHVKI